MTKFHEAKARLEAAQHQPPGLEIDRDTNTGWETITVRAADLRLLLAHADEAATLKAHVCALAQLHHDMGGD